MVRSQPGRSAGHYYNCVLPYVAGVGLMLSTGSSAHAWEFRCRFVERAGMQDVVLPGNVIDASDLQPRNIRIQFGVFDDEHEAAPIGGFLGWYQGLLSVGGSETNSDERRNNGRVAPFNFAGNVNANGNPPLPAGDPFTMLSEIDNTLGTQSPVWLCRADGTAPPMPPAAVRGLNTLVSTFAFRIDPRQGAESYNISASGVLFAATEWGVVGVPSPPLCNPPDGEGDDGSVTYAPFPTMPRSFSCELQVVIPAPAGSVVLVSTGALLSRRRRAAACACRSGHAE